MEHSYHLIAQSLKLLFCCLFFFFQETGMAATNYYFKQISIQQGLSQSFVHCIEDDYKGYVWIGTKSGLNRYHENEIRTYLNTPDSTSLPDNRILFLKEDSLQNLWISTGRGLALYDRKHDCFTPMSYAGSSLFAQTCMLVEGGVVFGSDRLFRYDYATSEIHFLPFENPNEDFSGNIIFIRSWSAGKWVTGTRWRGIWIYDSESGRIESFEGYAGKDISAYHVDENGNLWFSPYGKGLWCFDQEGRFKEMFTTGNSDLSNDIILNIAEKDRKIWLATDGGGICILEPDQRGFTIPGKESASYNSLPGNSVYCLHLDRYNNMWAGLVRGGLIGIHEVSMKTYKESPLHSTYGLSEATVLSVYEDRDGILWIGTDGGGLNRLDPKTNSFRHYADDSKEKVVSITEYSDRELLISEYGKGLFLFDKTTSRKRKFIFRDKDRERIVNERGSSINVMKLSSSQIYLSADSLFIYDIDEHRFNPVALNAPSETEHSVNTLKVIYETPYRSFLSGAGDIFELNNKTFTLTPIYTAQPHITINDVCRDQKGHFWIGTNHGLVCYDPIYAHEQVIENVYFRDVSSLTIDRQDRLWIGAQGLLFCYQINEGKLAVLGESDGVLPNEYIPNSSCIAQKGDIYIGGNMGMLRIDRNISFQKAEVPQVAVLDVTLNGVDVNDKIYEKNQLKLPWDYSSFILKVMACESDRFRKRLFRFNISGKDDQVIESLDNTLSLNYLPPGRYEIKASCSTLDGGWSEPTLLLRLQIVPPWWKLWWVRTLFFLSIVGLMIGFVWFVLRRKETRFQFEKQEHEKHMFEEKVRFLINISHELRTPLTLVYAPLQRLLREHEFSDDVSTRLHSIYKQVFHMQSIVNMVLDVHKAEVNPEEIRMAGVDMNKWIREISVDFEEEFRAKRIDFIQDMDPAINKVDFDASKLKIVITNLLMNALKFSNEGGEIALRTQRKGDLVRIEVADNGIGLGNVDVDKLFTRYYQSDHDRQGSGIGLSMCKVLVELHKGTMGAFANENGGATFYCEIPINASEFETIVGEDPSSASDRMRDIDFGNVADTVCHWADLKEYTLLIVEDAPELRSFLKESLENDFKKVLTAKDGRDALRIVKENEPDLILSDVMMPVMGGFELCQRLKGDLETSHIPIILLTARGDADSIASGYKTGADAYLAKPFDLDLLKTIVSNLLRSREQIKSRYRNNILRVSPEESTFSNTDETFLLKLNKTIVENLSTPELDVAFVLKEMGYSRTSLYTKVKNLTGMSVNDYINKFRIDKASLLLRETTLSIQEISERTGFNNQRYFSTSFKTVTGYSPSAYRKMEEVC